MRILYCTVGMPGAGKSTLLHNLDIDLPRAFPEAYNRAWWEDNILE